MHDLNTISRLNAEAHAQGIQELQAKGQFVVANYTGLTLLNFGGHPTLAAATAALEAPVDSPDQHRGLFTPTPRPIGQRDQTEDRTVADYAERVVGRADL